MNKGIKTFFQWVEEVGILPNFQTLVLKYEIIARKTNYSQYLSETQMHKTNKKNWQIESTDKIKHDIKI